MIARTLLGPLAVVTVASFSWGLLERSWRLDAERGLIEADSAAKDEVITRERRARRLADETRRVGLLRSQAQTDAITTIETGDFANADAPIDPDLVRQYERMRFGSVQVSER